MLIALWPLGEVRAASPSLLFRRDVEGNTPWPTRRWLAALPLVAGAGALVLWQAVSLTVGAIFLGAVAAALLVLALLARALAWLGRRRPRFPSLALRQGLRSEERRVGKECSILW